MLFIRIYVLRNVRQEPSKRPKRWATRSVYELTCDHCGLEFEKKYTNNKVLTSKHFCSRKCKHESQSSGLMSKIVQNPYAREDVKEKIRETNLQRYGVERPSQLKEVQQKSAATWLARYGVDAPMKSESIRKKSRETCMERYGVPVASQNEDVKRKMVCTNVERHGSSCAFVFTTDKIKQTNLKRYGVENAGWMFSVTKHERGHINTPWGTFWFRSSWERRFLEWCISTNTPVLDSNVSIPYTHDGKNRVYYADFLLQLGGRKVLCEIKPYVLAALEVNRLKFESARQWCATQAAIFTHIDESALSNLSEHFSAIVSI